MKKIPVTLICGFLWAWKTTLLKNILENRENRKFALIVNDMAEINIDEKLIKKSVKISQTEEKLIELSNWCICCTLREDLLKEIKNLCKNWTYDWIIIESTWIAEPIPIAQTLNYIDEQNNINLTQYVTLDCIICVVDSISLVNDFFSDETLKDRKLTDQEYDTRDITNLLTNQIEFCNVLIVNKWSCISQNQQNYLLKFLRWLQPDAKIITTDYSKVEFKEIFDTNLFDFEKVIKSPLWVKELNSVHNSETEEYWINSFVYSSKIPFHPEKLMKAMDKERPWVIRSKWVMYLASNQKFALEWSLAWKQISITNWWRWLSSLTEKEIENLDEETKKYYLEIKDQENWDRFTQIVVIWIDMDKNYIKWLLDEALILDTEKNILPTKFKDPFKKFMKI